MDNLEFDRQPTLEELNRSREGWQEELDEAAGAAIVTHVGMTLANMGKDGLKKVFREKFVLPDSVISPVRTAAVELAGADTRMGKALAKASPEWMSFQLRAMEKENIPLEERPRRLVASIEEMIQKFDTDAIAKVKDGLGTVIKLKDFEVVKSGGVGVRMGVQLREIAASMKPEWWLRRRHHAPEAIYDELLSYVKERKGREEKREVKAAAVAAVTAEKKLLGEDKASVVNGYLERKEEIRSRYSAPIAAAVDLTVAYYQNPELRPTTNKHFRLPPVRPFEALGERSREKYSRIMAAVEEKISTGGIQSPTDFVAYLAGIAQTKSLATYNLHRAAVIHLERKRGGAGELEKLVKAMPEYGELCRVMASPTKRSAGITAERRQLRDDAVLRRMIEAVQKPEEKLYVQLLRATGCRIGEAPSIKIVPGAAEVRVHIATSKTGCRRPTTAAPETRTLSFRRGSPNFDLVMEAYQHRGNRPLANVSPEAVRDSWDRIRKEEGLTRTQQYSIHALRHLYAGERKKEINSRLAAEHGADWREKLFGDWRAENNDRYMKFAYGELAAELGHTNPRKTQIYG